MKEMSTLETAKKEIVAWLKSELPDIEIIPADLTMPPDKTMGDLAYGCFAAAKIEKAAPAAIVKRLADRFSPTKLVAAADGAGPYLNFRLDRPAFATALLQEAAGKMFGASAARGERIMVEYGQANTHKEFHVGHLRNACLGIAVVNLARAVGFEVIAVNYPGDIGAHVAKCLWAFKKFHAGETPPENRGKYLGEIYAEATRRIEEDESLKIEVAEVQRKLEARDSEWDALWSETRRWSIEEIDAIFAELGASFDRVYYESEVEERGKALVRELLEKNIAKEGEGGALIVDLEAEKLGVFLVLKSDGSALYSTKELALAELKFKEYDVAASIHIVDTRQALYFKQFFATLERMGFDKKMIHLAYEFVTLKEGAMSSRKGNIVAYEDFRDEMLRRTVAETGKRHEDWDDKKVADVARTIALGAMKFTMLKQDIGKPIIFDIEQALAFDGFTGPYVQYAHARMSSILEKAGGAPSSAKGSDDPAEFAAIRMIADFPDVVRAAALAYQPGHLAQYLFDLAQAANGFYRDVPVLGALADDRDRRLVIARALQSTLRRGLAFLGIRAPEEM